MPFRSRRSSSARASSRPAPEDGFTLLEVLVALAILGIGVGVIFQGLGQGLRLRREATEDVRLAIAGETLLGKVLTRPEVFTEAEEGEEAGCTWRIEPEPAAPREGSEETAPLTAMRLTITSPAGRRWSLVTLLPAEETGSP